MKYKKVIIYVIAIVLLVIAIYMFVGNPLIYINNSKLKQSIASITTASIELNQIVPFEWDIVYTFEPYVSKSQIEEIIGFKSYSIKENNVSEGMVHLLFVKKQRVVASILGYGENLGYRLDFTDKIRYTDNPIFNVEKTNNMVVLTFAK